MGNMAGAASVRRKTRAYGVTAATVIERSRRLVMSTLGEIHKRRESYSMFNMQQSASSTVEDQNTGSRRGEQCLRTW